VSLASRLLNANPGAQVTTALTGALTTPGAKGAFSLPFSGYSAGATTTVLKFNFYSETPSTLSGSLNASYGTTGQGFTYHGTAGYFAGGTGGNSTTQQNNKLVFSTETLSALSVMDSAVGRLYGASVSNESVAGYALGGEASAPTLTYYTNAAKFTFSGESWSAVASGGFSQTNAHAGGENGSTAGYHWYGFGGSQLDAKKITFSNDSVSTSFAGPSGEAEYAGKSPSNGTTAGYALGGINRTGTPLLDRCAKLTYSNDSHSVLATTLSSARYTPINMSDYTTNAYSMGGYNGTSNVTTIQKMPYSTDTMSTLATTLTTARAGMAVANYHV